jgi:competence protein ComEC
MARVAVLPRSWSAPLVWALPDGRDWLTRNIALEIEQRRLFPWIAIFFGIGIVLFFQADGQPALWARLEPLRFSALLQRPFAGTLLPFRP